MDRGRADQTVNGCEGWAQLTNRRAKMASLACQALCAIGPSVRAERGHFEGGLWRGASHEPTKELGSWGRDGSFPPRYPSVDGSFPPSQKGTVR